MTLTLKVPFNGKYELGSLLLQNCLQSKNFKGQTCAMPFFQSIFYSALLYLFNTKGRHLSKLKLTKEIET